MAEVIEGVARYRPPRELRRMTEAAQQWRPHYENLLSLAAETYQQGWPFQQYPEGWPERAAAAAAALQGALRAAPECHYPERTDSNLRHLSRCLAQAAQDPASLSGRQVGLVRQIVADSQARWGPLGSASRAAALAARQAEGANSFETARTALLDRLGRLPPTGGIGDLDSILAPTAAGLAIPAPLARRVKQAWLAPVSELLSSRIVSSMAALEEIYGHWTRRALARGEARPGAVLREMVAQSWSYFPQEPPGRLTLDRWNLLLERSSTPLRLAPPSLESLDTGLALARAAARASQGTVYQRYFSLPVERLLEPTTGPDDLLEICRERARQRFDAEPGPGPMIEELRLLTSDGLWALQEVVRPSLDPRGAAWRCLLYLGRELSRPCPRQYQRWQQHRRVAHAWQRLVFFLSLAGPDALRPFIDEAHSKGLGPPELLKGLLQSPPLRNVLTGWGPGST